MISIRMEHAADAAAVEHLIDLAFGPGRHVKPSALLRGRLPFHDTLRFVAIDETTPERAILGSVRFTALPFAQAEEGHRTVLLLGPLAVTPARQRNGVGLKLIAHGLEAARATGHDLVFLMGDPDYYRRAGFAPVSAGAVTMPVPFNPARLMVHLLDDCAPEAIRGRFLPGPI
ncbi:MAG: GNAT family N-acetyltransferase [Alphaproteobacteria bacterium]